MDHCALLVGIQSGAAVNTENSMEVFQKIKNRTIRWPRNSTSEYLSKKIPKYQLENATLFTTAKIWQQPKCYQ